MTVRRFFLSAWLSYRALFTWLNPWGFTSTLIVYPIVQTFIFGALGQYAEIGARRPVVGGALLAIAMSALYGLVLVVSNERNFGTLEIRIATPEGLLTSLLGKAVPHVVTGLLGGALTLGVAALVFDVAIGGRDVLPLIASGFAVAVSCVALGIFCAAIAVRTRDTFTGSNVFELLLTLVSGVFVAVERLPNILDVISRVLPLRFGMDAALGVLEGRSPWGLLLAELGIGAVWGVAGYVFLRVMLIAARREGTLQLM